MAPDSADELVRMAAELRGVDLEPQADREPVEETQADEPEQEHEEDANWVPPFLGPKAAHQRLVDSIHGGRDG